MLITPAVNDECEGQGEMGDRSRGMVDVHTHVFDPDLPDLNVADGGSLPSVERLSGVAIRVYHRGRPYRLLDERAWSPAARLRDMDASDVAVQVLSPTPVTLCQDAGVEEATELATHQNAFLTSLVAAAPDRFVAFGHVPFQVPATAAAMLEELMGRPEFVGVEIGPQVGDLPLSHESYAPFWDAAERTGAVVFLHPVDHCIDPRIVRTGASFGLGMPTETAIAAADLLLNGVLAVRPGLRVLLAHGGGSLPSVLPRLAHGQRILPIAATAPSVMDLAARLWADSLTYDPTSLALAVERFGAGHLVVGSDYPFSAMEVPLGAVLGPPGGGAADPGVRLDPAAADRIRSANAYDLLGRRLRGPQPSVPTTPDLTPLEA
ncbi:amidohydrolase family protein [Raineyella sp. W15-4]|uniref:amidohydrolase family protein n=1 Tax=Raineyella sp. W15-4 TaxID=3081651 RepID=UPI002954FAB9|nr:amidohydrolase family protein [Raineyella sp. W15-4]WOQ17251.1 amidohydrolase family protein [Raineyella sp. W15-4]